MLVQVQDKMEQGFLIGKVTNPSKQVSQWDYPVLTSVRLPGRLGCLMGASGSKPHSLDHPLPGFSIRGYWILFQPLIQHNFDSYLALFSLVLYPGVSILVYQLSHHHTSTSNSLQIPDPSPCAKLYGNITSLSSISLREEGVIIFTFQGTRG